MTSELGVCHDRVFARPDDITTLGARPYDNGGEVILEQVRLSAAVAAQQQAQSGLGTKILRVADGFIDQVADALKSREEIDI